MEGPPVASTVAVTASSMDPTVVAVKAAFDEPRVDEVGIGFVIPNEPGTKRKTETETLTRKGVRTIPRKPSAGSRWWLGRRSSRHRAALMAGPEGRNQGREPRRSQGTAEVTATT